VDVPSAGQVADLGSDRRGAPGWSGHRLGQPVGRSLNDLFDPPGVTGPDLIAAVGGLLALREPVQ
jgi:hypothetical protein